MDPIEKLTRGFKAFRDGNFAARRKTYETLVDKGQKPSVLVIACADSRVDPALLLQAEPGDLFIVRNVANLVPPYEREGHYHGTSAALEYAVKHLKVAHVIVLGHAYCGGIRSFFDQPADGAEVDDFVPPWMSLVRPAYLRVEATMPDADVEAKARHCEQGAVLMSLENLMTFPFVQQGVSEGRLRLHGWHIDIRSCELRVYDPDEQGFTAIE